MLKTRGGRLNNVIFSLNQTSLFDPPFKIWKLLVKAFRKYIYDFPGQQTLCDGPEMFKFSKENKCLDFWISGFQIFWICGYISSMKRGVFPRINFGDPPSKFDITPLDQYWWVVSLGTWITYKHPKNWETALWGKERLYWKKGLMKEKLYWNKGFFWNRPFIEINALLKKLWNSVKIVKFGKNCEILVKTGQNC